VRRIVVPTLLAGIAAVLLAPAHARETASRIVDRTFSCEAGFVGGLYQVDVSSDYSTDPSSPVPTVFSSVTRNIFEAPMGGMDSTGVSVSRRLCAPAQGAVKLTTKGMRGGVVPRLGAAATCETPRRLLLRVRAVFSKPVTPQIVSPFGYPQLSATGDLELAAIAIGTRTGKTIAYLSVSGSEKARLFTTKTCKED
jgi:hypothetical protein